MTDWNDSWHPDDEDEVEVSPSVKVTKFGEDYEQRTPYGINRKPRTWLLKFTRPLVEIRPIFEFLEEKGGAKSFLWKDPIWRSSEKKTAANNGVETPADPIGRYVCRKWTMRRIDGMYQLTARFEQVYEAGA